MGASELAAVFGAVDGLSFSETETGLARAEIARDGAVATVFPYGAQVTRWMPQGARPVLFTSGRSAYAAGKAIRGGIPVIFPWFGPRAGGGAGPQHGFARTALWRLEDAAPAAAGALRLTLGLDPDPATAALWPDPFHVAYAVTIGRELRLDLTVENRSAKAVVFEAALHSYFAVSDIARITVTGLAGCTFIDKVDGGRRKRQDDAPITWSGERDSVYLDTPESCTIGDPGWGRRIVIRKEGAASTILWSPGPDKGAAMADLGDEWRGMVCVETGNVADNAIHLDPGAAHRMTTVISVAAAA
jgi:glucose-6-phosphate 1-epimerase